MKTFKSYADYHEYELARREAGERACAWIWEKHDIADAFFLDGSMSLEEATKAYKEAHEEAEKAHAEHKEIKEAWAEMRRGVNYGKSN